MVAVALIVQFLIDISDLMAEKLTDTDGPLTELRGDLFSCPLTSSLAHCVSVDLQMGKGIATVFKNKFGRVDELKAQWKQVGECAVLMDGPRFVYYLVTKEKFFHKPKLESIKASVHAMRDHCVTNDVKVLSMPRIGSGLDKLDWIDIRQILSDAFRYTQIKLCVYYLNSDDAITELRGDLFSCPLTSSLAHCVSVDLNMGKGIAKAFKNKFGRVDELKAQWKQVGECAVLMDGPRFVYYLVTKEKFFHKPKVESVKASVHAMRDHCVTNGVKVLSMPRIGSGLDKLDWTKIRQILSDAFRDTQIEVCVYGL